MTTQEILSEQWKQVADRRDLVFSLMGKGDTPDPAFIGAGITIQDGSPQLVVFSQEDEKTTRASIKAKVGNEFAWIDAISVMRSQGFEMPRHKPAPLAPLASLREHGQLLVEWLLQRLAGLSVGDGTMVTDNTTIGSIGCALQDGGGKPYYLTARHVLPTLKSPAYLNGGSNHTIGTVSAISKSGLDWSLILADPQAATPVGALQWDKGLRLTGPMSFAAVQGLAKQRVGISTQLYGRHVGTVVSIGTSLTVPEATRQVVVQSAPGDEFGRDGDSGAVAYVVGQVGADPPGTAIGLYWYKDIPHDLHLIAPLTDILSDISQQENLALTLL